jgi:hypothetical protein
MMKEAIRARVIVGEGGRIEIHASQLKPGSSVEVIVLQAAPSSPSEGPAPLSTLIGSCKGMFASRQEADDYLRKERESWDR